MNTRNRLFRRGGMWTVATGIVLMFAGAAPAPVALTAQGGNSNHGDFWVDSVGQPAGPGHEMDPHLPCLNINLWGAFAADQSGTYTIEGWEPSGSGSGDQAWPGTAASPSTQAWNYTGTGHDSQVVSVINVQTLVAHARANGDTDQPQQGLHFKLQLSQEPQKHKTFWVNCPKPTPTPTPTPTATPTPTPTPTPTATPTPCVEDCGGGGCETNCPTPTGTPQATPDPSHSPTAGVEGITTPGTGLGRPDETGPSNIIWFALLLLFSGAAMLTLSRRLREES